MPRFASGVVVVGGSAAGLAAADGLREGGYEGVVTVLDDNLEPGYDRPMLSKGLLAAGAGGPAPLRTPERLAAQRIEVLYGHRAAGLDIDRRLIVTSYGEAIPWDQVVIASGIAARRLKTTSGSELPSLRTLSDLEDIRATVSAKRALTIVGGGFIGLEAAAALRAREIDITVLCSHPLPLVQVVGPRVAAWLRDQHLDRGVRLELSTTVSGVDEDGDGFVLRAADGRQWAAPSVLTGVGGEPGTEWLIGSGVGLDGGVLTDEAGRSNVPGVWAAGDVANILDPSTGGHRRFEHWTRAVEQGRQVGLNIARGAAVPYAGVPYLWTEQYGCTLHVLGERRPDDADTVAEGSVESGEFVVLHGNGEELHAVTICGLTRSLRTYKRLLRSRASLAEALSAAG